MPPPPAVTTSINTIFTKQTLLTQLRLAPPTDRGRQCESPMPSRPPHHLQTLRPSPRLAGRRLLSRALRSSSRRTSASSHGKAAAQQAPPSAAHPPSAPGGFCFSHTAHFLEGNQLFPPRTLPLLPCLSAPLSFRHFAPIHSAIVSGKENGGWRRGWGRGEGGGLCLGNLNNFRGRRWM